MNVHDLHVPDLDAIILNRVEALEQIPFGKKQESDNAAQKLVGKASLAIQAKSGFLLSQVSVGSEMDMRKTWKMDIRETWKNMRITFDEEQKMYSILPAQGLPGAIFTGLTFSAEEIKKIRLVRRPCVGVFTKGEMGIIFLFFANEGIGASANKGIDTAEELFVKRLEEQTGLKVDRIER